MSIRPKGKEKWVIDYYPDGASGKRVQKIFRGSKSEALACELELRRKASGPSNRINPKIKDIMPEYLDWLRIHRAEKTCHDVKLSLKWLLPHFGNLPVSRITPTVINQYKRLRAGRPRAINKELNYLKSVITYMVRNNYANPLDFTVEMVPYKAPLPSIPHPADIMSFIGEIREPVKKAMVLFMWQVGLRYKEMKNILWENINWKSGVVNLTETKGSVPRICLLTEDIRAILKPLRKEAGYLFLNPKTGRPYESMKTLFKTASRRAGIRRINPHLLRHAFGTYTLDATGDIRLVQNLLGHRSITTTQIYTQIAVQRMKDGMARTANYLSDFNSSQQFASKGDTKPPQ